MVTESPARRPPPAGSARRSQPDYVFDFCGGHLAIDFTNTVGDRGATPLEHLNTYGDVVAWGEARGLVSRTAAAALRQRAAADPDGASRAWRSALELREALYHVLAAAAAGKRVRAADLRALNEFVADAFRHAALVSAGDRFALDTPPEHWLEPVTRPVIRAAVDLLTSESIRHVGRCADDSCAWLFLDTTRSRTRRWCDMKVCGNRDKVRRFRETN